MHLESTEGRWQSHSVRTRCDECGSEYMAKISTAARQIETVGHHQCRPCSSRRAGKKTAAKMSEIYSERMKGDGNFAKRPEVRAKISAAKKGVEFTEEHKRALCKPKSKTDKIREAANRPEERERRSRRMTQLLLDHNQGIGREVGFVDTAKTNDPIYCRSKFEKIFLERLDLCRNVLRVESAESLVIPYHYEGIERRYLPDFLITYNDGRQTIVELKGSYFQFDDKYKDKTAAKAEALERYCDQQGLGCVTLNEKEFKEWLRQPEQFGE